jgi:hypothetical protein
LIFVDISKTFTCSPYLPFHIIRGRVRRTGVVSHQASWCLFASTTRLNPVSHGEHLAGEPQLQGWLLCLVLVGALGEEAEFFSG